MGKVHVGGSGFSGAICGCGSMKPEKDIVVSAKTFFREIGPQHRCVPCVRQFYVMTLGPVVDPTAWDEEE
jgi:hypothetical protein